jgi:hypothetical protein
VAEKAPMVPLNINEGVRVKLTLRGLQILHDRHEELRPRVAKWPEWKAPPVDKDGWSEFQLWDLMQKFGEHVVMGGPLPFFTTIEVPAPKVTE